MNWQRAYRTLVTRFGAGGDMYGRNGHLGADYDVDAGDVVPAYEGGIVGYVALDTRGLGGVVGMKLDMRGPNDEELFAGWAHLDPVNVSVGQRMSPGDTIGHAAGWDGRHGTLWTGPHIHTTLSTVSSMNAALGIEPFQDPAPRIAAALTSTAGGDTALITTSRKGKNMQGVIYTDETADKSRSGAIINTESGFVSTFGWFPPSYADGIAVGFGLAKAAKVTRGQYNQLINDARALR